MCLEKGTEGCVSCSAALWSLHLRVPGTGRAALTGPLGPGQTHSLPSAQHAHTLAMGTDAGIKEPRATPCCPLGVTLSLSVHLALRLPRGPAPQHLPVEADRGLGALTPQQTRHTAHFSAEPSRAVQGLPWCCYLCIVPSRVECFFNVFFFFGIF